MTLRPPAALRGARRASRELLWVATGQGLAAVGGLAGVRLMTGMLDPATYGELALGMTVSTLVLQVVVAPLTGAFLRYYGPAREGGTLLPFLRASRALLVRAGTALVAITALLAAALAATGQARWVPLAAAALAFAVFSGCATSLDCFQNAARQRAVVAWHDALSQWMRFLAGAAFVWLLAPRSAVAMAGYASGTLVVLASQWFFFRRGILRDARAEPTSGDGRSEEWSGQLLGYARPFFMWAVFTWALSASDRWALQAFVSTREVGLYAVLYQLGYYPITLLTTLLLQLAAPILYGRAGDASDQRRVSDAHRLNRLMIVAALGLTAVGTLLAALLHSLVFSLLAGAEYRQVSPLLPGIVLSGGLYAAGQIAAQMLLTSFRTRQLLAPKVGTALLGIALNFAGAMLWGVRGLVAAGIAFGVVYLAWILYLARDLDGAVPAAS